MRWLCFEKKAAAKPWIEIERMKVLSILAKDVHNTVKEQTTSRDSALNVGYKVSKRILDIVLSVVGLIIAFLPMVVIALLIKLESPGPAIYIHHRIGKNGKPLPLLKFRSMRMDADKMIDNFSPEQKAEWLENFKLDNDPRITRIGRFLRKSSIDDIRTC